MERDALDSAGRHRQCLGEGLGSHAPRLAIAPCEVWQGPPQRARTRFIRVNARDPASLETLPLDHYTTGSNPFVPGLDGGCRAQQPRHRAAGAGVDPTLRMNTMATLGVTTWWPYSGVSVNTNGRV